jgi:signal transduction histidine kinase
MTAKKRYKKMPETQQTFELLKNYIDQIPIGILLFSSSKKLISWNKFSTEILEISEDELKKNDFGIITNQIYEALESNQSKESELIGLSKPLRAKKVITDDNSIILLISETYQEKIGEMSHELRRPITNIKTLTESLLLGAKNEPEVAQKFLEQINNEVDRLTRLVNELLSLSKIRSSRATQTKQKLKLKVRVDDAIKLLESLANKTSTKLSNEIHEGYEIYADPEQIDHVIQNLIKMQLNIVLLNIM